MLRVYQQQPATDITFTTPALGLIHILDGLNSPKTPRPSTQISLMAIISAPLLQSHTGHCHVSLNQHQSISNKKGTKRGEKTMTTFSLQVAANAATHHCNNVTTTAIPLSNLCCPSIVVTNTAALRPLPCPTTLTSKQMPFLHAPHYQKREPKGKEIRKP
ncbi:putative synapse differentiation-inducing protein 1-like [Sesbania bispinosa]|nr:putative synapse differentiation-inducing protein 1-like [Sesbania bispinosa]